MPRPPFLTQLRLAIGCGALLAILGVARSAIFPAIHDYGTPAPPKGKWDGPLFQYRLTDETERWSLSPFVSHWTDRGTDSEEWDVLYPLFSVDRFGLEYRYHIAQLINWSGGGAADGEGARKFTIFPFYFQQRSPDPAKNYTALFPFYGTMRGHLFRDEIKVVLAPLYLRTKKKDFITDNYLAPFFHHRHGEHVQGWQFWPLFGTEHRSPSTRTNGFGESEIVPGHDKTMFLWPFFLSQRLGLGTDAPDRRIVAIPFFNLERSAARDSTSWIWPFGYTLTHDREKKYREQAVLYPFVVWSDGEGKQSWRVWPFISRTRTPTVSRDVYLWPFFRHDHAETEAMERERFRFLFMVYSDLTEKNKATGAVFRRTDLWPLFNSRQEIDGRSTFQFPALVESALPGNKSVERNWSPVWSLYRHEKDPARGESSRSWLWNMIRLESSKDLKKGSILFGLLQYQTGSGGRSWRFAGWPSETARDPVGAP